LFNYLEFVADKPLFFSFNDSFPSLHFSG